MQNSMPFAASASGNVEHQEDEEQVRAEEERVRLQIEEEYNKQEAEEKAEKNNEVMAEAEKKEDQFRNQMEADFADGWVEVKSGSGRLLGGFSSFYICRAGGEHQCNTLILTKAWDTKAWARTPQDILAPRQLAPKQKWFCRCCGASYKTRFGMVVLIRMVGGGDSLSLASCTDDDDNDLHEIILQEQYPDVNSAEELYELIPMVPTQETAFLRKAVPADFWGETYTDSGVYKLLNVHVLESLPAWNWRNVANFFSANDLVEMALKVSENGDVVKVSDDGELVEC